MLNKPGNTFKYVWYHYSSPNLFETTSSTRNLEKSKMQTKNIYTALMIFKRHFIKRFAYHNSMKSSSISPSPKTFYSCWAVTMNAARNVFISDYFQKRFICMANVHYDSRSPSFNKQPSSIKHNLIQYVELFTGNQTTNRKSADYFCKFVSVQLYLNVRTTI